MLRFGQIVPPSHVVSVPAILFLFFSFFSGFVRQFCLHRNTFSFPHYILVLTRTGRFGHLIEKAPSLTENGCSTDETQLIFQPGRRSLAFISMLTITLVVALDATPLSIALPFSQGSFMELPLKLFGLGAGHLFYSPQPSLECNTDHDRQGHPSEPPARNAGSCKDCQCGSLRR